MNLRTTILICLSLIACKPSQTTQPNTHSRTLKNEQKRDIDSLFIVYSLPINVSYAENFTRPDVADSLIALLKRKKYKYLDSSAYAQLFKAKLMELMPGNSMKEIREMQANLKHDKNYYINKVQAADPFAQQIQLSFLRAEAGVNYINVKRYNAPNARKFRNWVITYSNSEPSDQCAARILDSLITTKRMKRKLG